MPKKDVSLQDLAREPWRTEGQPVKRIKIKPYKENFFKIVFVGKAVLLLVLVLFWCVLACLVRY